MRNLQSLSSTFPRGWPAIGLLFLRVVIGITALVESGLYFSSSGLDPKRIGIGVVLAVSGLLLLIGLRTALASVIFASVKFAALFSWIDRAGAADSRWAALYAIAIAVAVALLGPGSVSLDCRLFGPREIIIPPESRRF